MKELKIVREKTMANGTRQVTLEIPANAFYLMAIEEDKFYELGGQNGDIVPGHVLTEAKEVYWCHLEQKWNQK